MIVRRLALATSAVLAAGAIALTLLAVVASMVIGLSLLSLIGAAAFAGCATAMVFWFRVFAVASTGPAATLLRLEVCVLGVGTFALLLFLSGGEALSTAGASTVVAASIALFVAFAYLAQLVNIAGPDVLPRRVRTVAMLAHVAAAIAIAAIVAVVGSDSVLHIDATSIVPAWFLVNAVLFALRVQSKPLERSGLSSRNGR
jgi:hypothetical protein